MSKARGKPPDEPPKLEGSVEAMAEADDAVVLTVKLRNPQNRALHYIADPRGIIYDPATRRLRVQLSDQGRGPIPGGMVVEPRIRSVDPNSEASLTVRLPKTIVKLAATPSPAGDTLFEEHALTEADQIQVEIGWSDTPYYRDPRDKARGASSIASWEKQTLNLAYTPSPDRGGKRPEQGGKKPERGGKP